jgi:sugar/nucleoside kinase (ribokinase family)
MYDICCIGHLTLDKVITTRGTAHMPGGTSFYFSKAMQNMDVNYGLVTAVAQSEMYIVQDLKADGTQVTALPTHHTLYFENFYSENQDHRTQRVLQKADHFEVEELLNVEAHIFHLGPLLADDMSLEFIRQLSQKGRISLDVQGYLREVQRHDVVAIDWPAKQEALACVDICKANESELEVLTGTTDIHSGAKILAGWGVKEVVITLGSMGSVIYTNGEFYNIPAYKPSVVTDATGCGDTYMAGYLYQRNKGAGIQYAGEFAAAMASLKIASSGPFTGTEAEVTGYLSQCKAS